MLKKRANYNSNISIPKKHLGSYRDPTGNIFLYGERILRTVNPVAREQYEFIRDTKLMSDSMQAGFLITTGELPRNEIPVQLLEKSYVLEHEVVQHISYPYEWSFSQLKSAALHHLNFQLFLLERGAVLSDATAYNVQFIGTKPIFIDLLSIVKYQVGQYWTGYRQFCEQFLNPLVLRSARGVTHNQWYRGGLEGITTIDLCALLSFRDKLSWKVLSHVVLQAKFDRAALKNPDETTARAKNSKSFSKLAYRGFLSQLQKWISRLHPKDTGKTVWGDYAANNAYESEEAKNKRRLVVEFAQRHKPQKCIDLGCNTGDYSLAVIEGGAEYVVGYDFDHSAIDFAFSRAEQDHAPFLPLWLDASNPSPAQGWMQTERLDFFSRNQANAVLALAFEHHLAIGKNIPIEEVVQWIVSLAPVGLIEFVPKNDETIQKMLALREDIFPHYNQSLFELSLSRVCKVVSKNIISKSGRVLYEYSR